jgi:hypothetical protein
MGAQYQLNKTEHAAAVTLQRLNSAKAICVTEDGLLSQKL